MKRKIYIYYLALLAIVFSCKKKDYSDSINYTNSDCNFLKTDKEEPTYTGILIINSKGDFWFKPNNSDGLILNLVCPQLKENIHSNYDSFIILKNKKECRFTIKIIGHFLEKDTSNYLYKRRNFFVHNIAYL